MDRIRTAAAAAAILALVAASPVAAASASSSDTVTVPAAVTITGVPAAIDYGTVAPGSVSPTKTYPITIEGNTSFTFRLLGSALTGSAGTIACTFRMSAFDSGTLANMVVESGSVCRSTTSILGSAGTTNVSVKVAVAIPASTAPGTYSGVLAFEAVAP
jgi:hypothetical protein